jgi:hypothetical protein
MVGTEARMRVSSVIFWASSSGTLRSARTNTFFPFRSASPRVPTLLFVAITALHAAAAAAPETRRRGRRGGQSDGGDGDESTRRPDGDGSGDSPWVGRTGSNRRTTRWVVVGWDATDVLRVRRSNGRSVFLYRQTAGRSHTGGVWLFVRLTRGGRAWWDLVAAGERCGLGRG